MSKRCTRCLKWKDSSGFHRDRTKRDGLKSQCRDCQNQDKREYRARLRMQKQARLRHVYMYIWVQKPRRLGGAFHLSPGFQRWQEKKQQRKRERLATYLRRWHLQHRDISRMWQPTPAEQISRRQTRRADAAGISINTFSSEEWEWLLGIYGHRCAYCGQPGDALVPDHIIPLSQGGHNTLSNIVPACRACNARKGARTPEESGMHFAVTPDVTGHLEQLVLL